MAIDFATETTLRALSPALTPLSTEATQQQIVSAITSASGGVLLASETTAQSIDTHVQELLTDTELRATPLEVEITDGAGAVNTKALGTQVVSGDIGLVTNSVIHGLSTAGGGSYVDAKVSPSGSLSTEATISGTTDGGVGLEVPVTPEGHLEVAIHGPRLPFGSIHAESLTPIFQSDAVYGLDQTQQISTATSSGVASATGGEFYVSTGTTIGASASIQSRRRLRYRAGQGVIGRFTARFTSPVADSYQVAGLGHAEDGVYFAYKNTTFGILYNVRGVRETRTLTISTASTTAESVTVQLNGTNYSVAVTNSGNTARTAWEISQGTFDGWKARPVGSTVVFLRNSAGSASGSYGLTATTAVGSFAQTKAGASSTETFIAQSSWNCDTMDGDADADNPSGETLDPTKGNVFQIGIQYLGYGAITFQIEVANAGNNPEWVTVHTILIPNTLTAPSFGNPSFPFTMASYSAGSITNLTVYCASYAGFIEGKKKLHGNRFTYTSTLTTVTSSAYQVLFTIYNSLYYGGRANQGVINVLNVSAAVKHTQPCTIYIFRTSDTTHTLAGNPSFAQYETNSLAMRDTSATTFTQSGNVQFIYAGELAETGSIRENFINELEEITLQPGEFLSVCAKASAGTPSYVSASLVTREDH